MRQHQGLHRGASVALDQKGSLEAFATAVQKANLAPEVLTWMTSALERLGSTHFAAGIEDAFLDGSAGSESSRVRLTDHLHPQGVLCDLTPSGWKDVVSSVIAALRTIDHSLCLDDAQERLLLGGERDGWFPGVGLGIPHIVVKGLETATLVVVRLRDGIDLPSTDGEPVRLFFFLFDAVGQTEHHLLLLSQVAAVAGPSANRGLMLAAGDGDSLMNTIIALDSTPSAF